MGFGFDFIPLHLFSFFEDGDAWEIFVKGLAWGISEYNLD